MIAERLSFLLQGASLMFFLFSAISLFQSHQRSSIKTALAFVVAFFAFGEMKDILRIFPSVIESSYIVHLMYSIDMWAVGVCAAFIFELVNPNSFSIGRVICLTSGFILFTVVLALFNCEVIFYANVAYVVIYTIFVTISFSIYFKRYNLYIHDNYSNIENLDLRWVYSVVFVFFLSIAMWTIYIFNRNYIMKSIYYIVSLGAWIMLIARSKEQIAVPITADKESEENEKRAESEVASAQELTGEPTTDEPNQLAAVEEDENESNSSQLTDQMKELLNELMTTRAIYLNSHLTLADLAAELGTNRTYLSNYLNRELNVSFFDYINSYRVAHARRMIDADPDATVFDIVESCGFNSVSTFRRAFSREIGQTYGDYRQNALSRVVKS